jgi:hypothetical protein
LHTLFEFAFPLKTANGAHPDAVGVGNAKGGKIGMLTIQMTLICFFATFAKRKRVVITLLYVQNIALQRISMA